MEPQDSQTNSPAPAPQKPSKGYGKRPIWQWVVIYVIAAIIVYSLIYLIFIHKSSGGTGAGGYGY